VCLIEGKAARDGHIGSIIIPDDTRAEIAKQMHVSVREVESMDMRLSGGDQSLHAPRHEDGLDDWQDFLVDDSPSPEDNAMAWHDGAARSAWLSEAIKTLDPRERTIIEARHLAEDSVTLDELGHTMHVSKERVRQLETRALAKLKKHLQPHVDMERAA
jgi:RNA polymerase sigma-32 factor